MEHNRRERQTRALFSKTRTAVLATSSSRRSLLFRVFSRDVAHKISIMQNTGGYSRGDSGCLTSRRLLSCSLVDATRDNPGASKTNKNLWNTRAFRAIASEQSPASRPRRIALPLENETRISALFWALHKKAGEGWKARRRRATHTFIDSVALVRSPGASIGGGDDGHFCGRRKKSHHRPRAEAISFVGLSPTLPWRGPGNVESFRGDRMSYERKAELHADVQPRV